jgi:hypothetical protein
MRHRAPRNTGRALRSVTGDSLDVQGGSQAAPSSELEHTTSHDPRGPEDRTRAETRLDLRVAIDLLIASCASEHHDPALGYSGRPLSALRGTAGL